MKRFISLAVAVLMVLTMFFCLPFCAWADEGGSLGSVKNPMLSGNLPEKYGAEFSAAKPEKSIAEELRTAMVARNNEFYFVYPSEVVTESDLEDYCVDLFYYAMSDELSVSCVDGDYLNYQWYMLYIDYEYNYESKQYDIELYIVYNSENDDEYDVDNVVKEYLAGIDRSAVSDYELLKEFHNYILDICRYNYFDMENLRNYISAGVFVDGKAVCQGYAIAFYRLCREMGFDVRVIQSDPYEGCHAWNLVYIGDAYYYVDTTWDDQLDDRYELFLVDYETLQSKDSRKKEHKLYSDLYDDDEYFNSTYRPYISESVYDSTAKSIANCIIDVDYNNPYNTVVKDSDGNTLTIGEDYDVTTADDCYITIEGRGEYENTQSKRMLTIDGMTPDMEYNSVVYNGQNIKAPTTSLDGVTLGEDYIVSYPDYYGTDEYYNVIQGIGKYTGVIFAKYEIEPIDINSLGISQSFTSTYYNGEYQQPEIYFTGAPDEVDYYIEEDAQKNPGVYSITVCGDWNYTGKVVLSYEILKTPLTNKNISLSTDNFIYDGRAKEPRVYIDGLTENTDFTVSYSDNTATGIASVTVTGNRYYEGSRTINYYILPRQTRTEVLSTTSSSVTIGWQSVDDISGYKVEIYNGSAWSTAADVGAGQTSFTVSGLNSYTAYRFRVTPYKLSRGQTVYAYSSNEASTLTNYVSPAPAVPSSSVNTTAAAASSKKVVKPKKTAIKKLKTSKKTITVTWKKVSASGYQIQYSTSSKFKKAKSVTVKGSKKISKKISKLKKGKKYYVRVRAYKTVNGKKVYGSWSTKKSITVK